MGLARAGRVTDQAALRYGYTPDVAPVPVLGPDEHEAPATPWAPARRHRAEDCYPSCPRWPGYLGVTL